MNIPPKKIAASAPDADSRQVDTQIDDPSRDPGHAAQASTGESVREADDANFTIASDGKSSVCVLFKGCMTEDEALDKEALLTGYGLNEAWDRVAGAAVDGGWEVVYEKRPEVSDMDRIVGSVAEVAPMRNSELERSSPAASAAARRGLSDKTPPNRPVNAPPEGVDVDAHRRMGAGRRPMRQAPAPAASRFPGRRMAPAARESQETLEANARCVVDNLLAESAK